MSATPPGPSLETFEIATARRDYEPALTEALRILRTVDERYGRVDAFGGPAEGAERRIERIATRFAAAFGALVVDPAAPITPGAFEQLIAHHRWIELMFAASGFGSANHLVPLLSTGDGGQRRVPAEHFMRFLLIFSAAAGMAVSLDEGMATNGPATITAALGYLNARFCFSDSGHAFREQLLEWLPARLAMVNLGELALEHSAGPYMHCSYGASPRKHALKAPLMAQMRRGCLEAGCPEWDPASPPESALAPNGKPTVVVTAENFVLNHSIWRTHSLAVRALRARFHVVGVLHPQHVSADIVECFDELIVFGGNSFFDVTRRAAIDILARRPAMVLHLGVGLSSFVIALASLRLAPVQAASFGHAATTASPTIDKMILPEDFLGDEALFTEAVVRLPAAAMPYRARHDIDFAAVKAHAAATRDPDVARIAAPASVMKLSPPYFDALGRAAAAASRRVEFHFFPLGASDLGHAELARQVSARLPTAVVHPELPYPDYIARLAACDVFASPFPYGNMNSIVDAALVGVPGVCLDGPEAHAHADAAYFRRLGFPETLITQSVADYVAALTRLVDEPARLAEARAAAARIDPGHPFFTDSSALFAEAVERLIAEASLPAPSEAG